MFNELIYTRISAVWLILVVASLVSFESATALVADGRIAALIALVVAALKVRLVGLDFMELRHCPVPVRLGFELWLLVLFTAMIVMYWQSAS